LQKIGRTLHALDPGLPVVLLISLAAAWPFFAYAGLPDNTDAELHIFRLAELQRMVSAGVWYPRWAANFYFGYGYPVFNYYAPLSYWLGLIVMTVTGASAVTAIKTLFVLTFPVAGLGMYALVRDRHGRAAGLVAATAALYAPYLLYIDPHARGVLPELLSLALFPAALWSLDRLRRRPTPGRWLAAMALVAGVVLAHNLMPLVLGPLLFLWLIAGLWDDWQGGTVLTRAAWLPLAVFPLALALSAFFWLPMALEQSAIRIDTVIEAGSHYDYRNHFVGWGELLAPSLRLDWSASEPFFRHNLGLGQWVSAALALLAWFGLPRGKRGQSGLAFLAALVLIALMLPASQPVWERVPGLPYLQFPWRLLGPVAVLLAIGTGAGIGRLPPILARRLTPLLIVLLIALSLPLIELPPWQTVRDTSVRAVLDQELRGRWRGTTATDDFVPVTVVLAPREEGQVLADFFAGREPERLNRAVLGEATVQTEIISPIHVRHAVETPHPLVLRIFRFHFPGWRAWVNGESAEIIPSEPEGWITLPLEAGRHDVELRFGNTPARTAGNTLSVIALLAGLGVAWWAAPRRPAASGRAPQAQAQDDPFPVTGVAVGVVLLLLVYGALVRPQQLLHYQSPPWMVQPAWYHPDSRVSFEGEVALIGFDLPPLQAGALPWRAGQVLPVTLYWQAQMVPQQNYQVFVHLLRLDEAGGVTVVAQSDKLNPGDFPMTGWPLDKYVRDGHRLGLSADLPPGRYQLTTGLYRLADNSRLRTLAPPGEWFVLREWVVEH
jgi:hypothetical protein